MTEDLVLLEIKGSNAYVTLNRPDVHNAFDEHVIARLTAIWDELADRADITAVILRGHGKSFSAGGDLNWMRRAATYTEEENYQDGLKLATMLYKLYTLPQCTIASVHGAAMGGGFGLVSCCDIVLAQRDAKFALSEVRLGLIPATIGPYVMRAIGERQARRYFQTGERLDAARAQAIGLVHELYGDDGELNMLLDTILTGLHNNGPHAMRAAKTLCLDLSGQDITPEILKDTARRIARTRAGDEAKEGLSAFLEKRKPGWAGA